VPATALPLESAELVEAAGAAVEEQRVMVATAFDVDTGRDRIADVVALVAVLEADLRSLRLLRDDVVRDPDALALVPFVAGKSGQPARRGWGAAAGSATSETATAAASLTVSPQ